MGWRRPIEHGTDGSETPLGLVEGTVISIFYERPETAEFLRSLGEWCATSR